MDPMYENEISSRLSDCAFQLKAISRMLQDDAALKRVICDAIVAVDEQKRNDCVAQLDETAQMLLDMSRTVVSLVRITPCPFRCDF